MNVFLTVYNTSTWQPFINASGLNVIDCLPTSTTDACALLTPQPLSSLSALLEKLPNTQQVWIATVQAEHFIAEAIDNGQSLTDAANHWQQLTTDLLGLQSKQRRKIKLFNLHQALEQPVSFREQLGVIHIREYQVQAFDCRFSLLAASQYLTQQAELKTLNTLLQASALPLCENESLSLDVDSILQQLHNAQEELTAQCNAKEEKINEVSEERDLILAQLHQAQEELEKYFHSLQLEKETGKNNLQLERETSKRNLEECRAKHTVEITSLKNDLQKINVLTAENTQLKQTLQVSEQEHKHALLARDKQSGKEIAKLESELRKTKARAASAEFAGQLLQEELSKLKESISWKAATPVRMIGRLVKKTDEARDTLLQQTGLLLTSEYFDVDWYVRTYTDVAESKMNPAEHYLLFGATEGRLPGPLFDGNWYLQQYPDVAAANLNPLLHFIMYGQQEGRTSSPKLLTNNQNVEE